MKKILYNLLFTRHEQNVILNALAMRLEMSFYQNNDEQNRRLKVDAKDLLKKIHTFT